MEQKRPTIALLMKCTATASNDSSISRKRNVSCCSEIAQRLSVLATLDDEYNECDNSRRGSRTVRRASEFSSSVAASSLLRQEMCELCYRVCDELQVDRRVTPFAFSFLDRMNCDLDAYMLATIASLYMALKLFGGIVVTPSQILELMEDEDEGELQVRHILEMERIILITLDWRLNPPTIQCFVAEFCSFIPMENDVIAELIYERAIFFAELAVVDETLVNFCRSFLAVACVLNAMQGISSPSRGKEMKLTFLERLSGMFPMLFLDEPNFDEVQGRLWRLYCCSAQHQTDSTGQLYAALIAKSLMHNRKSFGGRTRSKKERPLPVARSPVSVVHGHAAPETEHEQPTNKARSKTGLVKACSAYLYSF